jgi:hypothetical protein
MIAPKQSPAPDHGIEQALSHLKKAEGELLAVVRQDNHPKNALLLEAHALLWETISTLHRASAATE